MNISTRIQGIPCQVQVNSCYITKGNYSPQAETPEEYRGIREIEFTVLDRKGYYAPWLEKKLTDDDTSRIEDEILKEYEDVASDF